MKTKLNAYQEGVLTLQAAIESLQAQVKAQMLPFASLCETDEGIDAYYDKMEQIEAQLGVNQAQDALRQAKRDLLAWARDVMRRKHASQFRQVEWLFDRQDFQTQEKLVEMCLRLAA